MSFKSCWFGCVCKPSAKMVSLWTNKKLYTANGNLMLKGTTPINWCLLYTFALTDYCSIQLFSCKWCLGSSRFVTRSGCRKSPKTCTKHFLRAFELSLSEKTSITPLVLLVGDKGSSLFFKCSKGHYDLNVSFFVTFSSKTSIRTNQYNSLIPNRCRMSLFRDYCFNRIVFRLNDSRY